MSRLLPLFALALFATAASAQTGADGVKAALDDLGLEVAMDGGVLEVEPTMGEFTSENFILDYEIELEAGVDYVLFVAADDLDVDPTIHDSNGEVIAGGFDMGNTETVEFSPAESGTYTISFLGDCDSTCAFGYSVFSR